MLEYSIEEAEELLKKNFSSAESTLKNVEEDLNFLRQQITTMEVSILLVVKVSRGPACFFPPFLL